MQHLILGYGYCGYYLAQHLLNQGQPVTAVSRSQTMPALPGLNHVRHDVQQGFTWMDQDTTLYYLIPPFSSGTEDQFLSQVLATSQLAAQKVIYCSTSGVYGDHKGAWVDEESPCLIQSTRQARRLDAEKQWLAFCDQRQIPCHRLRLAGIYGPYRLPISNALQQTPLIQPDEAPFINHIYVEDLAKIMAALGEKTNPSLILNVADGKPGKMGDLQRLTAEALQASPAPYFSFEQIWQEASDMKREFMQSSKRLRIGRLQSLLPSLMPLTPLIDGIAASLEDERKSA